MAKATLTTEQTTALGNSAVQVATNNPDDGIIDNVTDFVASVFKGEPVSSGAARWGGVFVAAAAATAAGMYTRKRALAGKDPMLGFFL